jgi:hypothetical protein
MASTTPMPDGVRQKIAAGATVLVLIAAVGNFGHVYAAVSYAGQIQVMALVISGMPDLLLLLCMFKLRYHHRSPVALLGLVVAVAFIGWGSIIGSEPDLNPDDASTLTRWLVGVSPLVFAVVATGLLEAKSEPAAPTVEEEKPKRRRGSNPTPPAPPRLTAVPDDDQGDDGGDLLKVARIVATELAAQVPPQRLNRDNLVAGIRTKGHTCNNQRGGELLRQLKTGAA